jgi:hypothetical protein
MLPTFLLAPKMGLTIKLKVFARLTILQGDFLVYFYLRARSARIISPNFSAI